MSTSLDSAKYLSLIDAGISNIWSLSLPGHLESLNLHGNHIQNICNLSHLTRLVHLDLSANQISVIDGLERLVSLKSLNLSSNLITTVDGLSGLRSLERLNLSYNQIENVSGLVVFSGSSCRLQYMALHGNKLRDLGHVVQALKNVKSLRNLVLKMDGSGNPLCNIPGYTNELWVSLPQLKAVNDLDRQGRLVTDANDVSSIPGLQACLDFLLLSDQDQVSEETAQPVLATPKIDAVVELFKQRYAAGVDTSSSETGQPTGKVKKTIREKSSPSPRPQRGTRSRGSSKEHSSNDDSEPVQDVHRKQPSKNVNLHNKRKSAKKTAGILSGSEADKSASGARETTTSSTTRRSAGRQQRQRTRFADDDGDGSDVVKSGKTDLDTGSSGDAQGREEAAEFYKNLMKTLETERERRWKAEQATRRLTDILKNVQAKAQESEVMKNSALEATIQLKQAVMNEHESNQMLHSEIRDLQGEVRKLKENLEEARRAEERSREALRAAEASLASKEAEAMAERMHQNKKLQEAQHRASALNREAELLRHSLDAMKLKVQQTQETLASREHQHREEIKNMYRLDSPELQRVIADRLKELEKSFQTDLIKQQEKVEQLSKQYSELEDEFRFALQMEETRFREIKADLERESAENMENKQLLLVAQRKDESSASMIAELTAMVKEQKGRIAELAKCKQEQTVSYKERIESLEVSLENYRKQESQLELLRQTKSRLQATIQAQESVIEGLKAERKLWGQELAQQGASLSQDRGRLEAKIEALNTEIVSLKKQLERETDAVKIKTKIVDDQTETIRKLKEAVIEREETIKATRGENLAVQRHLEEQLAEVKAALDDTRELLDKAMFRKDELKQQVADLQRELKESKDGHSSLSARWKEKSELIGRLEQQVMQMKNSWTQKEVQLIAERDTALKQAKQAIDQLKAADVAFRRQLEVKEASLQEKITLLEFEKQQEVELANKKVAIVEDEMRDLLQETEANKRATETKLKKLTQALGDLQSNLI